MEKVRLSCASLFGRHRVSRFGKPLTAPSQQENQANSRADGAVGHIEGREADFSAAALLQVEVKKIDNMLGPQTVDEVAENAATDQPESKLSQQAASIKMMPAKKQYKQSNDRDGGQQSIVAPEQAPGGPRVAPMDELKKTFDDHFLLRVAQEPQHDLLGQLIERHYQQGDYRDAPIGRLEDGRYESHFRSGR